MNSKIYILLPVHNRVDITKQFVKCLIRQTYTNYHLILIDDGSKDDTVKVVTSLIQNLTVIKGKGNWWWAGSLQQGYKWIKNNVNNKNDIVLIMNDDTSFDENYLSEVQNLIKEDTLMIGIEKGMQSNIEGYNTYFLENKEFVLTGNSDLINCMSSKGLFMSVGTFIEIGGFYPKLIPHYLSDIEFTYRAFRKGYKLVKCKDILINNNEETTGVKKISEPSRIKYVKMMFSKKNMNYPPIPYFFFILLWCPFPYKIKKIYKLIKKVAGEIVFLK